MLPVCSVLFFYCTFGNEIGKNYADDKSLKAIQVVAKELKNGDLSLTSAFPYDHDVSSCSLISFYVLLL